MSTQVCEPILGGGVLDVAFFNGRVLTAEDMQADQAARRQIDARLGRAIGAGVVDGFAVSIARVDEATALLRDGRDGQEAALTITAGLAIAPSGRTLELAQTTELSLVRPSFATVDSGFTDCATDRLAATATGVGLYLLTVSHATGFSQRAPMVGFGTDGRISGCGSRFEVQGVAFRLVKLNSGELGLSATDRTALDTLIAATDENETSNTLVPDTSRLRNRVAHAFFGTEALARTGIDPFALLTGSSAAPSGDHGALAALRELERVTDEETPLALLYWTRRGIAFVDVWSVRRRPSVGFAGPPWLVYLNQRRTRVAEAVWLQFQEQLATLQTVLPTPSAVAAVTASGYFRYLPPAGLLPRSFGGQRGFNAATFFGDLAPGAAATTDGNLLPSLFREALAHEPVDLEDSPAGFRRYEVWQNDQATVFASHTLPRIYGVGRHDTARWDWNRFA